MILRSFRLTTPADDQEFLHYDDALREAGKLLDPDRGGASWVRIEVIEVQRP